MRIAGTVQIDSDREDGGKCDMDVQVLPDQNLPAIEKALAGNRKRTTVHRLPGLNHLFQTCKTGAMTEYGSLPETLNPKVLAKIGDWIVERFVD